MDDLPPPALPGWAAVYCGDVSVPWPLLSFLEFGALLGHSLFEQFFLLLGRFSLPTNPLAVLSFGHIQNWIIPQYWGLGRPDPLALDLAPQSIPLVKRCPLCASHAMHESRGTKDLEVTFLCFDWRTGTLNNLRLEVKDDVAEGEVEDDDVQDDDVKGQEDNDVGDDVDNDNDDGEEEENDDVEDEDVEEEEEEDRSQDRDPHFVRACAIETHLDISGKPLYARIYRKNAAAQDRDPHFVRACAVETQMDKATLCENL
eukprot:s255_g16.t1